MKRITLLFTLALGCALTLCAAENTPAPLHFKRTRVIIDNDFCGDPDGLFQLVHHLLSKTTDIRGIIGGHLSRHAGFSQRTDSATQSVEIVRQIIALLGKGNNIPVVPGTETPLRSTTEPAMSAGDKLIVQEAKRSSPRDPLYVLCGGSLSNIASAWLMDPTIQDRIILIWIGGPEYPGFGVPPPHASRVEYNLALSIPAAQVIFNQSRIRLWQVPRNVYRQCIYSLDECQTKIAPCGKIGAYLQNALDRLIQSCEKNNCPMGEAYVLGDSPLVLLSSLQTSWEPDPASSQYTTLAAPTIQDNGDYAPNPKGRLIRVYTTVDTRLMFGDFEAKLKLQSLTNK